VSIIRSLPKTWEIKATTLKELNNSKEMNLTEFMSNLKTHEMKLKAREEREPQKKRIVAFKDSTSKSYKKNTMKAT